MARTGDDTLDQSPVRLREPATLSMRRRTPEAPSHTVHLSVRRTARVVLLGDPTPAVRRLWIACHGYAQLAPGFARSLGALAAPDRLIVVPEALNRFYRDDRGGVHGPDHPVGATWMTREERLLEIDDYCAYLDAVHDHVRPQLDAPAVTTCALGFSQGAQTVARWAARTTRRIDHVVLWGAGLPKEISPAAGIFGAASVTFVAGERDTHAAGEIEGQLTALDAAHAVYAFERFSGGHRLDDDVLLRLARRFG